MSTYTLLRVLFFLICLFRPLNHSCDTEVSTAKLCIFAYFRRDLNEAVIDSVAKHFDYIVLHDAKRAAVPKIRKQAQRLHRTEPTILVYKDCLTLIGPGNPWRTSGDSIRGGGATVGGFWHFDSIFKGIGYKNDTFFLMASDRTSSFDGDLRVKAGDARYRQYRWAMDWFKEYWAHFYARHTKIQCLRNYQNLKYDSTYFDGVFVDNVLHFNKEYGIYPAQYWDAEKPHASNLSLQGAVSFFLMIVSNEYKDPHTPFANPRKILAVGNTNGAHRQNGLFEKYLEHLDGGMEESFAQTWQSYEAWKRIIAEIEYAESCGKVCLIRTDVDTFLYQSMDDPLSITWYDTTQMMFGFTSYLMGCDSMTYFSFQGDYQHVFFAPILGVDIGEPIYRCEIGGDSIAYREFEKGLVYCNVGASPKVIDINKDEYQVVKASGRLESMSKISLAPFEGLVLKRRE